MQQKIMLFAALGSLAMAFGATGALLIFRTLREICSKGTLFDSVDMLLGHWA